MKQPNVHGYFDTFSSILAWYVLLGKVWLFFPCIFIFTIYWVVFIPIDVPSLLISPLLICQCMYALRPPLCDTHVSQFSIDITSKPPLELPWRTTSPSWYRSISMILWEGAMSRRLNVEAWSSTFLRLFIKHSRCRTSLDFSPSYLFVLKLFSRWADILRLYWLKPLVPCLSIDSIVHTVSPTRSTTHLGENEHT